MEYKRHAIITTPDLVLESPKNNTLKSRFDRNNAFRTNIKHANGKAPALFIPIIIDKVSQERISKI